ncbi:MAG: phosphate ABC transporter substrate-binding protein [Hydrogenophilales bacterium 28-61-23]|nr:MAG: phosphate ABC transporter substrate-binding protein [Hydrogenophilales bacterium 28-61-23]
MQTFLFAILLSLGAGMAQADVVVIVSAKSAVGELSKAQVADIFLGKSATFPGGVQAVPVDQAEGSSQRDAFHGHITGKSGAQLKSYWSKLVFSGKGTPPKELPNAAEVKKLVAANPNMIGYIDKGDADGSVKVVLAP